MPEPGGIYQTIGYLFSAEDMASGVVTKAEAIIEAAAAGVENTLDEMATATEAIVSAAGAAVTKFGEGFVGVGVQAGQAAVAVGKFAARSLARLRAESASAAVAVGGLLKNFLGVVDVGKGLSLGFKLFTGPLGLVMKLLTPIIGAIVDTLSPAMETFGAIVKNSLAPLSFLLETLAQQLAPMVTKVITPFVAMLEIAAVQAASFVTTLFKGGKGAGVIGSLFKSIGPVIMDIFRALGGLASELLPVLVDLFLQMVPVAGKIIKILGKMVADLLPVFGKAVEKTLPPFMSALVKLIDALLPLLPKLIDLGVKIIDKLIAPATIAIFNRITKFIESTIIPFIDAEMPKWITAMEKLMVYVGKAGKFLSAEGIGSTLSKFKALYLDPIIQWAKEAVDTIFDDTTVGRITKRIVDGFFAALKSLSTKGAEEVGGAIGSIYEEHGVLGVLQAAATGRVPGAAEGGIFSPADGGRAIMIAEAGDPEAAVPLTPEGVTKFMQPVLSQLTLKTPDIDIPGLGEVVGWLERIHNTLRSIQRERQAPAGMADDAAVEARDLGAAVGVAGMGG